MNLNLILLAFAPVLLIGLYIYFRDRYEKEPIVSLLWAFVLGAIITAPIILIEDYLDSYWSAKFSPHRSHNYVAMLANAAYVAFVVAALTEEVFKYVAFFCIWRNKNFNERFDGIVYAVFISLGFAAVENILYITQHGEGTGIIRAFTAVPAHAIFGITMGYYFGLAKFDNQNRVIKLVLALLVPILLHGIYDFILFSENTILLVLFVPFLIVLWIGSFRLMKEQSDKSVFKK